VESKSTFRKRVKSRFRKGNSFSKSRFYTFPKGGKGGFFLYTII